DAGVLHPGMPIFEVLGASTLFTPGDREVARRATGVFGNPCFVWTTHLNENKDPLTALDAFELAAPRLPDARFWFSFVKAPLLDVVRTRIASSSVLNERVTLLGTRPHAEMEQLHRAADFFVQTSHREASGMSLLES